MADQPAEVILGVDTHADVHVAALLDHLGRLQATLKIPTTRAGYQRLLDWAGRHGRLIRAGVEGTGTYGAGLTRFLTGAGVQVIEVDRPNRQRRWRHGKSDPTDAEAAARAVLAGEATATPKTRSGIVEAIRVLRVARTGVIKARTQAANQLRDLLVTAPEELHAELYRLSTTKRVQRLVAQQPDGGADPASATHRALWHLARRHQALTAELAALNADLATLTRQAAPRLLARYGVGVETAGQLLVAAGDNPDRLHSEAALAALCGASPVEASSGKTVRHRLNRGGDRQANNALWVIALTRLRDDPRTRAYAQRRTTQGKTPKEILRCLKRYLARELFPLLTADLHQAQQHALTTTSIPMASPTEARPSASPSNNTPGIRAGQGAVASRWRPTTCLTAAVNSSETTTPPARKPVLALNSRLVAVPSFR
jgi:transposase